MNDIFEQILQKLKQHITTVDSIEDWLFIAVNTMKNMENGISPATID